MPGTSNDQSKHGRNASSDMVQLGFWSCVIAVAVSVGMVLAWPDAVGVAGPILLTGFAVMAGIMMFWRAASKEKRRIGDVEQGQDTSVEQTWLDALGEMSVITDSSGLVEVASHSYRDALSGSFGVGDDSLLPAPDGRLFGSDADATAAIYRLNRAARQGMRRSETFSVGADVPWGGRVEVVVSPLGMNRALWRICRAGERHADQSTHGVSDLYVDDAPIGFFAMGADGKVIYANSALCESLPVPGDIVGQGAKNVLLPASAVGKLLRSRQTSGRTRMDLKLKDRDGSDLPVTLYTSWVGKGAHAVSRSIMVPQGGGQGDQKDDEAVVAGMDLSSVPFGAVELDGQPIGEAMIVSANPAIQRLAGAAAEPGSRFVDLFDNPEKLNGADNVDSVEMVLAGSEGVTVDVYAGSLGSQSPATVWLVDVSRRKSMQMQMERGQKMQAMGRLIGGVAHDFNNLLLGMILNVDKLLIRHPVGDPSFMDLQRIKDFASRGAELVRTLLAYSRRQTFRKEVIEISDLLSDYFILLRQIIDERISVNIQHGRDLPRVEIDKGQIETALTNLATNARDAMLEAHGGGQLTIRTGVATAETAREDGITHIPDGSYLLIDISDTGPGLHPKIREEMFQPFFTTKENGNGLGLATVYGIVKQSDGYIYAVSQSGHGARFRIFLPVTDKAVATQANQTDAQTVRVGPDDLAGRGTILLVEDEEAVRGVAAELLGSLGYRVQQAGSGEQALKIVQTSDDSIDLVISDVVLPEMDGPALLRAVRPHIGDTPVMFISGYAERELTETLNGNESSVSFLPKPFTLRQLAERVKAELDDARAA